MHSYYKAKQFAEITNGKKEIHNVIFNQKMMTMDDILDQVPLRMLINYLFKKVTKR